MSWGGCQGRAQRWPMRLFRMSSPFGRACVGAFAGWHERQLMLRQLTRRGCLNGAANPRREFGGAPRKRPGAGCPVAKRRGRRQQGRPFLVTFFGQKKSLRRRAHHPAPSQRHEARTNQPPNPNPAPLPEGKGIRAKNGSSAYRACASSYCINSKLSAALEQP